MSRQRFHTSPTVVSENASQIVPGKIVLITCDATRMCFLSTHVDNRAHVKHQFLHVYLHAAFELRLPRVLLFT